MSKIEPYGNGGWTKLNDNDKMHCEDGPAVYNPGTFYQWWINGKCHRLNGPAVEFINGAEGIWWVRDKHIMIY
jgi:hypothetical protein